MSINDIYENSSNQCFLIEILNNNGDGYCVVKILLFSYTYGSVRKLFLANTKDGYAHTSYAEDWK